MPTPFSPSFAAAAVLLSAAVAPVVFAQAPIERAYPDQSQAYAQPAPPPSAYGPGYGYGPSAQPAPPAGYDSYGPPNSPAPPQHAASRPVSSQPIPGVFLRVAPDASVKTVSADQNGTEIRVEHGIANVFVRHPAKDVQILIDLPNGSASLVEDGAYTFNADTNTLGVLQGEADALNGNGAPIRVKEDHQLVFAGGTPHPHDAAPTQLRADLVPAGPAAYGDGYAGGNPGYAYPGYAYGPYGDGYYPYPYYAYGWGYPWGWGYPYVGLGFGYWGGFRGGWGGGFRGGYGGGGGFHPGGRR